MKFYHINSAQCKTVRQKLIENDFEFEEITDIPTILKCGIIHVPMLEIEGEIMDFIQSLKWFKRWKDEN